MLELRSCGREQFLADTDMIFHRPADIEKQQQLDGVEPLGDELQIEPAGIVRGRAHGAVEIELFGRPLAGELPQAAQRQLDVAGAELDGIVEVAELAAVPDLHRAAVASILLADAHAFGIVTVRTEGRGAGGADPFAPTLMSLPLLGKALPSTVAIHSFRSDHDLEAKDSQHGILCGEVIHTIAPDAELLFANWDTDRYAY